MGEKMQKGRHDFTRGVLIIFYFMLAIMLGIIIVASLTRPQHNLFAWQMWIGTFLMTMVLLACFILWRKYIPVRIAESRWIYWSLFVFYGILLYGVSCANRNSPDSLVDYAQMWRAATETAEGKMLSGEAYFLMYANNIKPMLLLSVLFRIASFLGFQDPFYFVLAVSVAEVMGAAWAVGVLVGRSTEEGKRYRIPVLLMFVFLLPIWANVQAFYTDSMSFCIGVMGLALMRLSYERERKWQVWLLRIVAGILVGIGITIKVTIVIPFIAVMCTIILSKKMRKEIPEGYCVLALMAVITYILIGLWAESYEIWQSAKDTCEPVIDWIALGLKGDGSYRDNLDYIHIVSAMSSKAEKARYAKTYIWENRNNFFDVTHLIQKCRCNFASGHLGTKDYTYYSMKPNNIIWELFSPWGKYYWRISQLTFCYLFGIYTVYFLGTVLTAVKLIQGKEVPVIKMVADVSLFGIIVFLMIWEANNRQLYNQMPIILLGGVMNIRQILDWKRS